MDERKSNLFRKQALEKISSPEQLEQLVKVTLPYGWIALIGISVLLVAILVWSVLGTLNTVTTAPCIMFSSKGGTTRINTDQPGTLTKIFVPPGGLAKQGDPLMQLRLTKELETPVRYFTVNAPFNGKVIDYFIFMGEYVTPGASLAAMEPAVTESDQLIVHAFIRPEDGKWIKSGMPVLIALDHASPLEYGYLIGNITAVSPYPRSSLGLMHSLQNEFLVNMMSQDGGPFEALISLKHDPKHPNLYLWTSKKSEKIDISPGSLCSAHIVIDSRSPIKFVFPTMN